METWMTVLMVGLVLSAVAATGLETMDKSCSWAPYDENCVCEEGERKVSVPWLGKPKWSCENIENLLLDPESPTFETDALAFAENYFSIYCGSVCTDFACGAKTFCNGFTNPTDGTNECIEAVYGHDAQGSRLVNLQCIQTTEWNSMNQQCFDNSDCDSLAYCYQGDCVRRATAISPWKLNFLVESETNIITTSEVHVISNYCYNAETGKQCMHQSICDYYIEKTGSADWCVGDLPLIIVPTPVA